MPLAALTLTAFRSYTERTLDLAPGLVVLTGPNGAGKTNVLEAISLLAPGRGLRGARLADFQKVGAVAPWAVAAVLEDGTHLGTGRDPASDDSTRRVAMVEGQRTTPQAFLHHLAVSWLTPAMDRLWTESPSARRRFLDRLTAAVDPAHATHLNRYEDALTERNRLLREGVGDAAWLSSLEHVLATDGMIVAAARRETVRGLRARLSQAAGGDEQAFPAPLLTLEGVETWLDEGPALAAEDRMRDALGRARTLDRTTGTTSVGPHRTDLQALHPVKGLPAALCSTGEQKALLIRVVLAHADLIRARRRLTPVLLLDEVGAHLDETRRGALFSLLQTGSYQSFLTGADAALFAPLSPPFVCHHTLGSSVPGHAAHPPYSASSREP